MSNKSLLTIIAVLLLGFFALALVQTTDSSPFENLGDNISQLFDSDSNVKVSKNTIDPQM